jgi:hypothetical protein
MDIAKKNRKQLRRNLTIEFSNYSDTPKVLSINYLGGIDI